MTRALSVIALALMLPTELLAHAEQPRAVRIAFPAAVPGSTFVLTDGQGLFADPKGIYQWLCEDAVSPAAGWRGLAIDPDAPDRWVVVTTDGGYISTVDGCDFQRMDGPLGVHRLIGLWTHPMDRGLWTASATPDVANDLFRSDDFGRTWTPKNLGLRGLVRVFLQSPVDPRRIFLSHSDGLLRSDDGGESFVDVPLDDPVIVRQRDFRLLAMAPDDADTVFAAVEDIRGTAIIRSTDAGDTWEGVGTIRDFGLQMLFDPTTGEGLVGGPVSSPQRSDDGGDTWVDVEEDPLPRCLALAPDGRLWGCLDPYFGAPWAIGASADFGRTWDAILPRYEVVAERWDCALDSRARQCCRGLCPGLLVPPDQCGEQPPPPDLAEECAQPSDVVLTPLDAGIDAEPTPDADLPDAEPPDSDTADVGPIGDARPPLADAGEPADDSTGCNQAPGHPTHPLWWALVALCARRIVTIRS